MQQPFFTRKGTFEDAPFRIKLRNFSKKRQTGFVAFVVQITNTPTLYVEDLTVKISSKYITPNPDVKKKLKTLFFTFVVF